MESNVDQEIKQLYSKEELKELEEKEREELEQINQPIAGTYIVCREVGDEKYIGTIGGYKVTEEYNNINDLKQEVIGIKYNEMYPVITALVEMLFSKLEELNENK